MLVDSLQFGEGAPKIDFAANAASLGAISEKVANIAEAMADDGPVRALVANL